MGKQKAPAFQLYARDWLSDLAVTLMPLAAQGAYIRLLCHQWLDGSIPDDMRSLAALCGTSEDGMAELWPCLKPCFEQIEDGALANPRLAELRRDDDVWRKGKSEDGKRGAAKRWAKAKAEKEAENNDGPANSPAIAELKPSNSSSSSSSSSVQLQGDEEGEHIGNHVNELWRSLGIPVPRGYNWVLGAAKVSRLTEHWSDIEILEAVRKVDQLKMTWVKSPAYLSEPAKGGGTVMDVVMGWRDEEKPEEVAVYVPGGIS